jgi:hypothetical protein
MAYVDAVNLAPDADELLTNLALANGFSKAELADNRAGKISDGQMMKLMMAALRPVFHAGKALVGWLLFVLVIRTFVPDLLIWFASMFLGKSIFAVFAVITMGCVLALVVGVAKSGRRIVALFRDVSKGAASTIEGRVWASRGEEQGIGLDRLWGEKVGIFHYVLNNEYFEVPDLRAHEALLPKERYRLYYAPKSKLLLSIEPATGEPAGPAGPAI